MKGNQFMKYLLLPLLALTLSAENQPIPSGATVYLHPMGGFESYLAAAFQTKKVPLTITKDLAAADYEIEGDSNNGPRAIWLGFPTLPAGTLPPEHASITVTDRKSGSVIFAYSVSKGGIWGKKSTAESCAKHIRKAIK